MIAFEQAQRQLMAAASLLATPQTVPLAQALGKVLAQPVISAIDVPPSDNSAVDGYALDAAPAADVAVSQRIPAGAVPAPLMPATAARIFTGAALPAGADRVVMQEDCETHDGRMRLLDSARPVAGDNIRRRGQDVRAGDVLLHAGEKLLPWHLGLLASVGIAEVDVYAPLRIAVLSTGNELQQPGEAPQPGKIFNSNRYLLLGLLQQCGFEAIDGGCVADQSSATEHALAALSKQAHMVVTTGGVSVGEEDHVRAAVEKLGALSLWKIAIKPGKPFAFGRVGDALFAGLPGNPSAVLVTFLVLLKPFLDVCQGRTPRPLAGERVAAGFAARAGRRQEYLRVQRHCDGDKVVLQAHPNQSSGMLSSACWADGLAVQPAGVEIGVGDPLLFLSFAELLH